MEQIIPTVKPSGKLYPTNMFTIFTSRKKTGTPPPNHKITLSRVLTCLNKTQKFQ